MKKKIIEYFQRVLENPILTSTWVLILVALFVTVLSIPYYTSDLDGFLRNLLAEAHGSIFDIIIIGILILWLNQKGQKRQQIRAYKDEIDDFRLWESEEAAFRTVGNIKRLNRHDIFNINLVNCHLARANLNFVQLNEANLNNANISNSNLMEANLDSARLNQTNFENSNLNQVNLNNAFASGANFKDANLIKAKLNNAYLIKANFKNAFLMEANLNGANVSGVSFENANLYKADLRHTEGLTIDQMENVRTLYLAQFDKELYLKIKENFPELIGR
ncbi:pentapeptide repeat-containing protein [Bacteroidota bacterium]